MAQLRILNGPQHGESFPVSGHRIVIGRGEQCDLRIDENSISRKHAAIDGKNGIWRITDLDSQNGLFIDGKRVAGAELTNNLQFRLGNVQLEFSTDGLTAATTAPPAAAATAGADKPTTPDSDAARTKKPRATAEIALDETFIAQVKEMSTLYPRIETEFGRVIVGQRDVMEELLIAIAANGHCLMVGLPGLAKTLMVSTLSQVLQLTFKRIQFTPDLMPSDILGTDVLEVDEASGKKSFRFIKGPVFTNMLLADEINRTPPKTQAALLESMQERQVTIANNRFPLPEPFFVLATQNPLEQEGTYPLPEAQLDRFMFNITVDYPGAEHEEEIVERTTARQQHNIAQVLSAEQLLTLQDTVRALPVSRHIIKYATALVRATRPADDSAPKFIRDHVFCGAGPRAGQFLVLGAKARAVIHGRLNVSCDDIRALALPVMRHRIFTNFTADSEGVTTDDLIRQVLEAVHEPAAADYQ